ncbi:MAG: lipocalin-like domain-containing protein [Rhodoferax sp.]
MNHWATLGRRGVLGLGASLALGQPVWGAATPRIVFPRDAGAHPDFATEWWYVTGCAAVAGDAAAFGFQLTFFRSRVPQTQGMQSGLAARQLVFAHAALTDVKGRKLWHDQRMARWSGDAPGQNPADTASASAQDTGIRLRDWTLEHRGSGMEARLRCTDFALSLNLIPSQPVLLQGDQGLSRKGPEDSQTSYYYSLPHLQVRGELELRGKRHAVEAGSTAWLDHEWSQEMLHPDAVGWDWIGINLFDGSALTAFRLRNKKGMALWDGGSFRAADTLFSFHRGEVVFQPLRAWKSPLSQASYPVEWLVRTPADFYTVRALVDNQEMDSRASTGAIYWEGLCEVLDSNQRLVGRGYLEMTGYAAPIRL